jgi:hypothetical protein
MANMFRWRGQRSRLIVGRFSPLVGQVTTSPKGWIEDYVVTASGYSERRFPGSRCRG